MVFKFNKNYPTTIEVFCAPICNRRLGNKYAPIGINFALICTDKNCSDL